MIHTRYFKNIMHIFIKTPIIAACWFLALKGGFWVIGEILPYKDQGHGFFNDAILIFACLTGGATAIIWTVICFILIFRGYSIQVMAFLVGLLFVVSVGYGAYRYPGDFSPGHIIGFIIGLVMIFWSLSGGELSDNW